MSADAPKLTRVLGLPGLTFFLVAALVNLNSIPVVSGIGPAALLFWIAGFLLFFLPQAVAVAELSSRFPQEGGIYNWNKTAFGGFHGFISGWCYWTNNIFYIPTLLFYIVGFAAFVGGEPVSALGTNATLMAGASLVLLWVIVVLNILGLRFASWVQAAGATGTFLTAVAMMVVGLIAFRQHGMANAFELPAMLSAFTDWKTLSLLSVVCLNYVGLELGSVIGEEIKEPRRNIPRAILIAGASTVLLYVAATVALEASIPASDIGVIDGILQGVRRTASSIGLPWLLQPVALLMSLNAAGNASAWLAGSARIPFVIGIDRYLPAAFGRVHPRFHTPHVSLVVQGFASSLFIAINAVGATVTDMYMILLQTTVILQLIPYLYMFLALIVIRRYPERHASGQGYFHSATPVYASGILGFVVTVAGMVLAFIPTQAVSDVWNFEFKTGLGVLSFLVPAFVLYAVKARRRRAALVSPPVEVAPD